MKRIVRINILLESVTDCELQGITFHTQPLVISLVTMVCTNAAPTAVPEGLVVWRCFRRHVASVLANLSSCHYHIVIISNMARSKGTKKLGGIAAGTYRILVAERRARRV